MLSSYPSDILHKYTSDNNWNTQVFNKRVTVNKGADKIKSEVLTMNYTIK